MDKNIEITFPVWAEYAGALNPEGFAARKREIAKKAKPLIEDVLSLLCINGDFGRFRYTTSENGCAKPFFKIESSDSGFVLFFAVRDCIDKNNRTEEWVILRYIDGFEEEFQLAVQEHFYRIFNDPEFLKAQVIAAHRAYGMKCSDDIDLDKVGADAIELAVARIEVQQ